VVVLELVLAAGGLVALFVAVFFRALQRWSISPPLLGLVTGALLGAAGHGLEPGRQCRGIAAGVPRRRTGAGCSALADRSGAGPGIATEFGWSGVMFGLAALLFRHLPALLALKRPLRADWTEVIWLGWFGPIGVAALFYLGHADEQGVTDPSVWTAGTLVITLSTVVHGLTAAPGRLGYRRHLQRTPG
jgi:hypothetical protein